MLDVAHLVGLYEKGGQRGDLLLVDARCRQACDLRLDDGAELRGRRNGSTGLPLEAVGLLIAVDWFTGIFRTFLNVNGDTMVALLAANGTDEIDRDVYAGSTSVTAEAADEDELSEKFAAADRAD